MKTRTWRWKGTSPAELDDHYSAGPVDKPYLKHVKADLFPGKTFVAPDDWEPMHHEFKPEVDEETGEPTGRELQVRVPHPMFEEVNPKEGGPDGTGVKTGAAQTGTSPEKVK